METLRSWVEGRWHEADGGWAALHDPATEREVARASSRGVDFARVLDHARSARPALAALGFAGRAGLLKEMSRVIREHRDELLELSRVNTGTTRPHGAFDVDGGSGTLAWYAGFGRRLGDGNRLVEGDGVQLARTEAFWGQHVLVPRQGVAVAINAFNFPVWGFAEKAACALLAGMPLIVKPATATAWVAARAVAAIVEAGILPEGALQLVVGSTGDLLDRLGPQDVLAFTGSADTANRLKGRDNLLAACTRVNVEADSLNAAVLSPAAGVAATDLFFQDVVREMTQKSGQKCTAVRRILVPAERLGEVEERLVAALAAVVTGDPGDEATTMGPLATADQLADTERAVAEIAADARIVHGTGRRTDGHAAEAGRGWFFAPTLLRADAPRAAAAVHRREAFAPVATLLPYDGSPADAGEIVALAGGTLVTSVYGDDPAWLADFLTAAGPTTGRLYVGSESSASEAPGSGIALPQTLHGGPGRAGGGEELGGLVGVKLYMQRVALQGSREMVGRLTGVGDGGNG
ncbi:MAG TPA: 3,4-dehydroadipyl-CoA semialdehyde dehydrogenase [Thermoanaerobaculia bacterium]